MKLANAHSSGSLHRRVRRMLIQCIAIVVLLSTSVGLGIGLYQDVYARDQLLSNAAQMAADAPLLTDTIQTDTAQQYLERTVRRVAAVDMLGIYDVQGKPLVFYDLAAGEGEASVLPTLRADTVRRLYSEQKPLLSSDEMPEGADRCAYAVVRDENGQAFLSPDGAARAAVLLSDHPARARCRQSAQRALLQSYQAGATRL